MKVSQNTGNQIAFLRAQIFKLVGGASPLDPLDTIHLHRLKCLPAEPH